MQNVFALTLQQFEQKVISLPDNEEIKRQLNSISFEAENRNKIEDKRIIRQKLGYSPDETDALAISFGVS